MELFSLVITARMIIDVRFNIATRNCFYEHIVQANYLFVPVRHKLEEQSRNCFKQLNFFGWPKAEKKALLASASVLHSIEVCLFVRLKRSWLGTKVHK